MKDDNVKLIIATALGVVGGLALGLYLWGSEENKRKISIPVDKLFSLIKDLEAKDALTSDNIKDVITNIFDKTEAKAETKTANKKNTKKKQENG